MQGDKKKLGMFNIYSLGVGGAIGSGIFVMMGMGIAFTGRSIVLAIVVSCLYMLLAYLFHPIMASMFVLPGGDYDMKAMLFGPTLTGVSAIFTYVTSISTAAYAIAMVDYMAMIFPGIQPYAKVLAVLVVTIFFATTIKGSKFVATLNSIMTVVLLAAIVLFVAVGVPQVQAGFLDKETFFLNGGAGFMQAVAIMSFACQGTTMGPVAMMEVTNKPRRIIPVGIMLITVTVALVYGLMSVVASGVLPVEEVAGQNLAKVASAIFPHGLYVVFILGGAVFAIATSLMSKIAMLRYPCVRVAQDGWLPAFFKKETAGGYPYVIQALFYVFSILPILLDFSLDAIVSMTMIPYMLMNAYLNLALIPLVKKYPQQWKTSVLHMPTPIFNVLCVVGAACSFMVTVTLFQMRSPMEKVGCIVITGVCVVLAVVRLKTGAVKKEDLIARREEIAQRAIEATEAERA